MSPERKITRHTITGEATPDFFFLGVVSSEADYRLSVMINIHLAADLRKDPDEISIRSETGDQTFSRFTTLSHDFSLVSNRCNGNLLLRKLKNIDFIFLMSGHKERQRAERMAATLREIQEITAVFVFDSREVNDRNLALLTL